MFKENKRKIKLEEFINQYKLENISEDEISILKDIASEYVMDDPRSYPSQMIIRQNWLIIKLLSEINNKLDK